MTVALINDFKSISEEITKKLPNALQGNQAMSKSAHRGESFDDCFAVIDRVVPGSVAETADLRVGDRIKQLNDISKNQFKSISDIIQVISTCKKEATILSIQIRRLDSTATILVTIEDLSQPLGLYLKEVQ